MSVCKRCGKFNPTQTHECKFVVGQVVRLPDDRTAVVVGIKTKFSGDVVTVELPGPRVGVRRSYPTYLADELRWVQ